MVYVVVSSHIISPFLLCILLFPTYLISGSSFVYTFQVFLICEFT